MSLDQQAAWVTLVTLILYLAVITGFLFRGRPLVAGILSLLISFLPVWWQSTFTDSEAPGFGLLLLLMVPIPLLLITIGLIISAVQFTKRQAQP